MNAAPDNANLSITIIQELDGHRICFAWNQPPTMERLTYFTRIIARDESTASLICAFEDAVKHISDIQKKNLPTQKSFADIAEMNAAAFAKNVAAALGTERPIQTYIDATGERIYYVAVCYLGDGKEVAQAFHWDGGHTIGQGQVWVDAVNKALKG